MSETDQPLVHVLIVEDDGTKRDRVVRALLEVPGVTESSMTHAIDLAAARDHLQVRSFDLLVLDIALPARVGRDVIQDGGATLLREIVTGRLRRPEHIFGLTAFDDVLERLGARFRDESFVLLKYDATSEDWRRDLQARLRHIVALRHAGLSTPEGYASFLVVLCALQSELEPILNLPWGWESPPLSGDATAYHHGTIRTATGGALNVYAAAAPRMGMVHTAVLASKAIVAFRPRYLAMTGIAAGVRGEIELGTVIAPDPVYDYNAGKWTQEDAGATFAPDPYHLALDTSLRDPLRRLAGRTDVMVSVKSSWPAAKPPSELKLQLGPLASGAAVIADDGTVRRAVAVQRKLLGIDMEAYGLFAAAAEACEPRPRPFALKTVVDFADTQKSDDYQAYGSYVSARLLAQFVEEHLSE